MTESIALATSGGVTRVPMATRRGGGREERGEHQHTDAQDELGPHRAAEPGDLVHVEIDAATSTTLKGTQLAAVAA